MRKRTVNSLIKALKKGDITATLKIYDIMYNHHVPKGAYLNLGENRYFGLGEANWNLIKNNVVNEKGEYFKNITRYAGFYK